MCVSLEFDGALNGSRSWTDSQAPETGADHNNLAVRLTTGCHSSDCDLRGND